MKQKVKHFMDEADIGSGEKTPAEQEDMEQTAHLREQQEQANKHAHAQDGSQLQQVIEEQQYILQQENHIPHSIEQHPRHVEESSKEVADTRLMNQVVQPSSNGKRASPNVHR